MVPDLSVVIILFSQILVGILGNCSLLFYYFMSIFTRKSLMPKDEISKHVAFANFLIVISRGIDLTIVELGLKYILDHNVCKFVIYLYRVARGASLHSSSLLSCFQAITVNPSHSRWMKFKHRAIKYIVPSCSLSWLVHLLLNSRVIRSVTALATNINFTKKFNVGSCLAFLSVNNASPFYIFLISFIDVLYLCIMVWSNVSMVSFLYRHKKQVQYIHSALHSLRVSPEDRATQSILILVGIYVTSYSMSFILILYLVLCGNLRMWLMFILVLLDNFFPTLFPFIVINNNNNNNSIFSILLPWHRKK